MPVLHFFLLALNQIILTFWGEKLKTNTYNVGCLYVQQLVSISCDQCNWLWVERSGLKPQLHQDVYLFLGEKLYSLSASFSPPRNINGYKKIIRKALENAGESLDGLTSNTEGVIRFFVNSCSWNLDKLWPDGPGDLQADFTLPPFSDYKDNEQGTNDHCLNLSYISTITGGTWD